MRRMLNHSFSCATCAIQHIFSRPNPEHTLLTISWHLRLWWSRNPLPCVMCIHVCVPGNTTYFPCVPSHTNYSISILISCNITIQTQSLTIMFIILNTEITQSYISRLTQVDYYNNHFHNQNT